MLLEHTLIERVFYTPERFAQEQVHRVESPRGRLLIASCRSGTYLAYSRQDKPTKFSREPTTAKFMADATLAAGVDRLVTWNPHSESIRGFYDNVPVNKLEALVQKLVVEKGIEEVYLGVSHYLGMDIAQKRLLELHRDYHLMEMIVTNSIPQPQTFEELSFVSVYDLSDTFSRVINRIHYNRPVSELFYDEE